MTKIKLVKWGIANSYPKEDLIEIHEDLEKPEYESLKKLILAHEMEHIQRKNKGFWKQRAVDFKTDLKFKDLLPFIKTHKKAFIQQYSPISYKDNTIYFEFSLIFLYLIYLGIGIGIYFLIKTFSTDQSFFYLVLKNLIIGLIIVFGIYFGFKWIIREINKQGKE